MAYLAGSLRHLFREVDAVWPDRDRSTDGWIGDPAHQARKSDHNPDSRGIVHAIDIDRDGIDPYFVVGRAARLELPASYIIYNRQIWSRKRDFDPRPYTGENPHTSHIHVSIMYGVEWEADEWEWGIADLGKGTGSAPRNGPSDDMGAFEGMFGLASDAFHLVTVGLDGTSRTMEWLMN